jgi:hypothetical protein
MDLLGSVETVSLLNVFGGGRSADAPAVERLMTSSVDTRSRRRA